MAARKRTIVRKLLLLILPAALASVLLLGCFEAVTSYVVNEDGSGSQTLRIALPAEMAELFGSEMPTVAELEDDPEVRALAEALGDQGEITFFSSREDGFGFEVTVRVPASDDFGAALEQVLDSLPDSEIPLNEFAGESPTTIRRDGNSWIFQMDLIALADSGLADAGEEDMADFASMFLDDSNLSVQVLLPGTVVEHNADEVLPDGTLRWNQGGSDPARSISARSDLSSSSGLALPMPVIIGIAVVLVALLIGVMAFMATRGPSSDRA